MLIVFQLRVIISFVRTISVGCYFSWFTGIQELGKGLEKLIPRLVHFPWRESVACAMCKEANANKHVWNERELKLHGLIFGEDGRTHDPNSQQTPFMDGAWNVFGVE